MPGKTKITRFKRRLRVGRKRAIYLPQDFLEALGLREGDKIDVELVGDRIVIKRAADPFLMVATKEKWAIITVEEFEEESEVEQESWGRADSGSP